MITVVLDDDPTGTQAMANVPIVLDWSDGAVGAARPRRRSVRARADELAAPTPRPRPVR